MKFCPKCNLNKPISEFGTNRSRKDGLSGYCRICDRLAKQLSANKNKETKIKYREKNKDKIRQSQKIYRDTNKEKIAARKRKCYAAKKEYYAAKKREYYIENKEKFAENRRRRRKADPGAHNARNAKYRAMKLQATPKWAEIEAIKEFYRNCPAGYHVDHIVPLNGKNVCGLHVLGNLQYLPAIENIRKSNKWRSETS